MQFGLMTKPHSSTRIHHENKVPSRVNVESSLKGDYRDRLGIAKADPSLTVAAMSDRPYAKLD
jgi:hypothetical protein